MPFDRSNTPFDALPPLYVALSDRDLGRARALIAQGAAVDDIIEADGDPTLGCDSVLHRAARDGDVEMVNFLLAVGCPQTLEAFDYLDQTPLIGAASRGHRDVVRALIDAGANIDAHNEIRIGNTAIREAVSGGHVEVFELLHEAGADPTIPGWMGISAVDHAHYDMEGGLHTKHAKAIQHMLANYPSDIRERARRSK